jgi:hypothetical protein
VDQHLSAFEFTVEVAFEHLQRVVRETALLAPVDKVEELALYDQYADHAAPEHAVEISEVRVEEVRVIFVQLEGRCRLCCGFC